MIVARYGERNSFLNFFYCARIYLRNVTDLLVLTEKICTIIKQKMSEKLADFSGLKGLLFDSIKLSKRVVTNR
jgi:hypothetical protein